MPDFGSGDEGSNPSGAIMSDCPICGKEEGLLKEGKIYICWICGYSEKPEHMYKRTIRNTKDQ